MSKECEKKESILCATCNKLHIYAYFHKGIKVLPQTIIILPETNTMWILIEAFRMI